MADLVETVARAIANHVFSFNSDKELQKKLVDEEWPTFADHARVAIAAIPDATNKVKDK